MQHRYADKGERIEAHLRKLMAMGRIIDSSDRMLPFDSPAYEKGAWSCLKLMVLEYYIPGYLNILGKDHRVAYVDLFSGPGLNKIGPNRVPIPGSPMIAVMHPGTKRRFQYYVTSEIDAARRDALEARIRSWRDKDGAALGDDEFQVCRADANDMVRTLPAVLAEHEVDHCLVFIDPEGFEFGWTSMETLVRGVPFSDLIINFPSAGLVRNFGASSDATWSTIREFIGPGSEKLGPESTEQDALRLYRDNLARLGKDASMEIEVRGTGAFHYHMIPAVRSTARGSPWFEKILGGAKSLVEDTEANILELIMAQIDGKMGRL